jgi:hypothetical protein
MNDLDEVVSYVWGLRDGQIRYANESRSGSAEAPA